MTETELEVREALMGRTIPMEKGRLRTMGADDYRIPIGVGDGADAVRFLGLTQHSKVLSTELSEAELYRTVKKSMHKVGRSLLLIGQPETPACLIRYVLTRPAVVTVRYIDDIPVVTSWAGRGLTGWISNLRAMASFRKQLPDTVTFAEDAAVPKDEKIKRRDFRREVREMKKQQRAEKKNERQLKRGKEEFRKKKDGRNDEQESGEN